MKYQVGDLVVIKNVHHRLPLRLENTLGIITATQYGYIWYSQIDQKEYHFHENEFEIEVIK